jgi:hypothetical protein
MEWDIQAIAFDRLTRPHWLLDTPVQPLATRSSKPRVAGHIASWITEVRASSAIRRGSREPGMFPA